jgi:hypothetical protein
LTALGEKTKGLVLSSIKLAYAYGITSKLGCLIFACY